MTTKEGNDMGCIWWKNVPEIHPLGYYTKYCPSCKEERSFKHFKVIERGTYCFCIPGGSLDRGEFIQCTNCGAQYAIKKGQSDCCWQ